MGIPGWLSRIAIDWSRFDEGSRVSKQIVEELAANRPVLRAIVLEAAANGYLRTFAEKHNELNYIVLYNALDRGLRMRLHRFAKGLEDIPHNHRFSFSSVILSGSYRHTMYELNRSSVEPADGSRWYLDQPVGTYAGEQLEQICVTGLTTILATTQAVGSCYSLHHQAIHKTAMPESDAFSLFIRGPAQKRCSLQFEPEKRTYRWKFGREREAADVVDSRVMSSREYDKFIESLESAGVI